jgi:hypothetical protein
VEDHVKHHLKRQLRRLASERPYQIVATSAAALVLASTTGALLVRADDAPAAPQTAAAAAELAPSLDQVASLGQVKAAAAPSPSSSPSPSASAKVSAQATPNPDLTSKPAAKKPPASKVLDYEYQAQTYYYNCGPAAVRNALSADGVDRTQDELAVLLGTTEMGTNSAEDTTRGLNASVKGDPYRTHMIPGTPSPAQMDQLQADVVAAVSAGRAVVSNVAGDATDTDGGWHSYPGGHYIAVVGYQDDGRTVKIADSANPAAASYWVSTIDLANWMATRGYSA